MRFLIVASTLVCAVAAQAGLDPYAIAPAVPTISAGDINGAAIDAHVEAADQARAAYDTSRQIQDKANELQGQAVDNAVEQAWRAVDGVKTTEARLDGAAAAAAPVLAKQLVGRVAPVGPYAAPAVAESYPAPAVGSYAAPAVAESYPAPVVASYPAPDVAESYFDPGAPVDSPYPAPEFAAPYYSPYEYPQY